MKRATALFLTLALLLALTGCQENYTTDGTSDEAAAVAVTRAVSSTPVTADTDKGQVGGYCADGVDVYRGIPYAEPPVGDLRFCPPEEKQPWDGVLDCTSYNGKAVQINSTTGALEGSEDCLYLNVWAPDGAKNLPVMFWIHGGSFVTGYGGNPTFDGTQFAKDGVIVVTFNYRMGALGFLALDTLRQEYGTTGNWGTLDQIMALQWVNDNIQNFGGDPDNITIAGESAGAFAVSNLIMSPKTDGLFARAILQSGNLLCNRDAAPLTDGGDLDESEEMSRRFAEQFGAEDDEAGLETLRSIDAYTLWDMGRWPQNITTNEAFTFWPVEDGAVIPSDPLQAMRDGDYQHVPILLGCDTDEGTNFIPTTVNEADIERYVYKTFREDAPAVLEMAKTFGSNPVTVGRRICTLSFFWCGAVEMASIFAANGGAVYFYQFDYLPTGADAAAGIHHAIELPFVFGNASALKGSDADLRVLGQVHNSFVNFITSGDPNRGLTLPDPVDWPEYDPGNPQLYYFRGTGTTLAAPEDEDALAFFVHLKFHKRYHENWSFPDGT